MSDNGGMSISTINTRELSKETARILRELKHSEGRLITRGGEIVGILVPPSGQGVEHDIDLLARLRLGQAFSTSQREAVISGNSELSGKEIDAEIRAARRKRHKRDGK